VENSSDFFAVSIIAGFVGIFFALIAQIIFLMASIWEKNTKNK
jgi:hypothetical protein